MASMVMLHNHSYMIEAKESTEKDPFLVNGGLILIGFCCLIPTIFLLLLISRLCCQQPWKLLASKSESSSYNDEEAGYDIEGIFS